MPEQDPTLPAEETDTRSKLRSIAFATVVALITSGIGGIIGYGFNEYMRDKKILEVSSSSSGNLASMPVSIAGNLEILLPVSANRKEAIKSLVRYDVKITNKTEQGVDDVVLFLTPPKDIELVASPDLTTEPPALASAITVKQATSPSGNPQLTISLINPSQTVKIGYLGFSRDITVTGNNPLSAVVLKKDWSQKNVTESAPDTRLRDNEFILFLLVQMGTMLIGLIFFLVYFQFRSSRRLADDRLRQFRKIRSYPNTPN